MVAYDDNVQNKVRIIGEVYISRLLFVEKIIFQGKFCYPVSAKIRKIKICFFNHYNVSLTSK